MGHAIRWSIRVNSVIRIVLFFQSCFHFDADVAVLQVDGLAGKKQTVIESQVQIVEKFGTLRVAVTRCSC